MPLTPAQRQQNYRNKLKNERPEKLAEIKKINAERSKRHYRNKVKNYTEAQREELRRKWKKERLKAKENNINAPISTPAGHSKEKNVEFEDEMEIKEEVIEINDYTDLMLVEELVADIDDITDPIKTEELQEVGLRSCLENSQNQTNKEQILLKDFETDDTDLSNKLAKGIPEDPDVLFFFSLLPDMKEMSRDQKRRFKIGVLQLANDILQEK